MCPSHKFQKNKRPCHLTHVLIHEIKSYTDLWCMCFHDLTTWLIGLNARDYDSLPNEDAKYHALDNVRGAIMRATIQKSVSAHYTNFVMADGEVLFTQKDRETAAEMTDDIKTAVPVEGSSDWLTLQWEMNSGTWQANIFNRIVYVVLVTLLVTHKTNLRIPSAETKHISAFRKMSSWWTETTSKTTRTKPHFPCQWREM